MSHQLEQKYEDVRLWFEHNCNRYPIVDQEKRWRFTLKALESFMHIAALAILDLRELEHREAVGRSSALYLPSGMVLTDGWKKNGG